MPFGIMEKSIGPEDLRTHPNPVTYQVCDTGKITYFFNLTQILEDLVEFCSLTMKNIFSETVKIQVTQSSVYCCYY